MFLFASRVPKSVRAACVRAACVRAARPVLGLVLTLAALSAFATRPALAQTTISPRGDLTIAVGAQITFVVPSGNVTLRRTKAGIAVTAAPGCKVTVANDGQITIESPLGKRIIVHPDASIELPAGGGTFSLAPDGNFVFGPNVESSNAAPVKSALSPVGETVAATIEALYLRGNYDEAIKQATQATVAARANPRLLYFRGEAAYSIGDYAAARRDFSALGAFKAYSGWPTAQSRLGRIDKMLAARPPRQAEVRDTDGTVIFRVYYDEENSWSRGIMALLPQAYRINRDLLGRGMKETPVFIFKDASRYEKFLMAHDDAPMGTWVWAIGGLGALCFCQEHKGAPRNPREDYFRGVVVHEFNHNLVRRITGNASLPTWFEEGLAMTAEPLLVPQRAQQFGREFQTAAKADALLPLQIMTGRSEYNAAVESRERDKSAPFPQGWSMTTYLLLLLTRAKLTPFLEDVRDSRDFDQTLLKFTGLTPAAFYAKWRAQLPQNPA